MSHINSYLISPRNVGRDRHQVMGRTSAWRLKQSLHKAADEFVKAVEIEEAKRWRSTDATSDEIRGLTRSFLQQYPPLVNLIDPNLVDDRERRNGDGVICDSIRELWGRLSESDIVSSEDGRQIRRSVLGAMCGESTTYADVHKFVNGSLSREAFNGAKRRREDAMGSGQVKKM